MRERRRPPAVVDNAAGAKAPSDGKTVERCFSRPSELEELSTRRRAGPTIDPERGAGWATRLRQRTMAPDYRER